MARSKEFDENVVLLKAMQLFWEQGYEKTSMQELVEHMGIHRRSLYDTFGDKHSLFVQALARYARQSGAALESAARGASTAADAIRGIFDYTLARAEDRPQGCLLVNTATELASRDADADRYTRGAFGDTERLLEQLIVEGQRNGEFPASLDPALAAETLHTTLVGLRVLARTSTDRDKLRRIAEAAMRQLRAV